MKSKQYKVFKTNRYKNQVKRKIKQQLGLGENLPLKINVVLRKYRP